MSRRKIFEKARIVDTINESVYNGWFSVVNRLFEYVEEGNYLKNLVGDVVDLSGGYVVPGLIDAHMHIESSLLTPRRFAEAVIPWGTCAVLQDPHEMANVFGVNGVRFMIENSRSQALRIYTAIPSCVPPTRKHLETCNAKISAADIVELSKQESVVALGEVMDYNGVLDGDEEIIGILAAARSAGLSIEGHCPTLKGQKLSKYIACGIRSDHTLTNPEKIREQLRKGIYVMLQAKSVTEENLTFIMKLKDKSRILFVTDDIPAADLLEGHLNQVVQLAISKGWNPIDAIASATIRPADYLGIKDLGSISPGKVASFLMVEDLGRLRPERVFINGEPFSSRIFAKTRRKEEFTNLLRIRKLIKLDLRMLKNRQTVQLEANIITMNKENSLTDLVQEVVEFKEGYPLIEHKDLVQIAVFRRDKVEPTGSIGLVKGLGLQEGAFATSFAHDSHNLLVVGKEPEPMVSSANAVIQAGGGMAVSDDCSTFLLKLPIGGLITDEPFKNVATKQRTIEDRLKLMGVKHQHPLILLSVLALTVSPHYKMSDLGIVDT
ncbi:MAG: adenine deaminase C-terminal domain-containing protein, partial [Desulfatiglandales bacterium]